MSTIGRIARHDEHGTTAQRTQGARGAEETRTARPGRRTLLVGAGTLGAGLALGAAPAVAAPTLRRGDRGSDVTALQNDLNALGYWCGEADGSFGHLTQQAVWALQKVAGISTDGVVGATTRGKLDAGTLPTPQITSGIAFEVDKSLQVIMCITNDRLYFVLNTSTASGERYYSGGRWKTAVTPTGDFAMDRVYDDGWQHGELGDLYCPGYYDRGWAIHGSTSIPTYPASHGCSRISVPASDFLWGRSWFVLGRRVLVHD